MIGALQSLPEIHEVSSRIQKITFRFLQIDLFEHPTDPNLLNEQGADVPPIHRDLREGREDYKETKEGKTDAKKTDRPLKFRDLRFPMVGRDFDGGGLGK
jgi:hypothetical protein